MTQHIYKLKYLLKSDSGNFLPSEINEDEGLCDAMAFISILHPENGSYSQAIFSHDGRTNKELTDQDKFKIWSMLGLSLSNESDLKGWHKQLVNLMAEALKQGINLGAKK